MAYKRPLWFGISVTEFYDRHKFSEFDVMRGSYGRPHIIPHNPHPGAGDGFEVFRQSMNAIGHLAGSWPVVKIVAREHVEFRWTEHIDSYPVTDYETFTTEWRVRPDVREYAYYIGPLETENLCHCAVDGDYCGEGCDQPQNKAAVLKLKEGGCDGK